jgi:CRISPR-associated protein Csb1
MSDTKRPNPVTLKDLQEAVASTAAAFRCRRKLQPGGGAGDKVFPPTYAGAVYAVEQRRVPGREEPVTCVLLDSVQSQANRMEQALQEALGLGELNLPVIEVDFSPYAPTGKLDEDEKAGRLLDAIGKLTSLQVPHRLADAILRDSEIAEGEGAQKKTVPFRKSHYGNALNTASPLNATPIYELCPTALLFGMWDSTGPKGGLGAKFERAIVSEVVGFGAEVADLLRGVRRDPLDIRASVKIQKATDKEKQWTVLGADAKGGDSPSAINHSSVPFPKERDRKTDKNHYAGVTLDYAEQLTTLSLIALRRLRFPVTKSATDAALAHAAGQTVLAALGLCAATLAFESGMGLRSRCLLWPEGPMEWELLAKPGETPQRFTLDSKAARKLLADAVSAAEKAGLNWRSEPLALQPSKELLKLVRLSQQQAVKAGGDEGAE